MAFKNYADSILKTDNFKGKALYVAIANTMEEGMDIQNVEKDTTVNTAHIRSILQFVKSLENNTTNNLDFKWKYYNDDSHGSVPLISEYDEEVSKRFGFEVLPAEELINGIGYYLLGEKMPDKAAVFFDLNIKNYPNSSNVYDSRGDCYLAEKDSLKALEFFNKALKLEDLEIYQKQKWKNKKMCQ